MMVGMYDFKKWTLLKITTNQLKIVYIFLGNLLAMCMPKLNMMKMILKIQEG